MSDRDRDGEHDALERVTREDEARRKFEDAAEVARRAHADPEPDRIAPEERPGKGPARP